LLRVNYLKQAQNNDRQVSINRMRCQEFFFGFFGFFLSFGAVPLPPLRDWRLLIDDCRLLIEDWLLPTIEGSRGETQSS
jgi:hypothetical protein